MRTALVAGAIAMGIAVGTLTGTPSRVAAAEVRPAGAASGAAPVDAVPYSAVIQAVATRYGLPPHLVEAVIHAESNFDARAVSAKGARGLMQLMPATAMMLGVRNAFDAQQNIEGGVRHLVDLLYRFSGNLRLALAAYNAGEEAVRRHGGVPPYPETIGYVERIVASYERGARRRPAAIRSVGTAVATDPIAASSDAEVAVTGIAAVAPMAPERSVVYSYETQDGALVFTNIPRQPDARK